MQIIKLMEVFLLSVLLKVLKKLLRPVNRLSLLVGKLWTVVGVKPQPGQPVWQSVCYAQSKYFSKQCTSTLKSI